jgi:hypothetical protein
MSTPAATRCPECGGRQMPNHPAGFTFDHLDPFTIRDAEDATQAADTTRGGPLKPPFVRPLTDAEHVLVTEHAAAHGIPIPPDLVCRIDSPSPSVRTRHFYRKGQL